MRRMYYRTVKNNQVRILGKRLSNPNLNNGELDGLKFCFIIYNSFPNSGWFKDGLTCLWGTERLSKAIRAPEAENAIPEMLSKGQRELIEAYEGDKTILSPNGFLNWYFWKEVKDDTIY